MRFSDDPPLVAPTRRPWLDGMGTATANGRTGLLQRTLNLAGAPIVHARDIVGAGLLAIENALRNDEEV